MPPAITTIKTNRTELLNLYNRLRSHVLKPKIINRGHWGTWIRTTVNGSIDRCPAAGRSPNLICHADYTLTVFRLSRFEYEVKAPMYRRQMRPAPSSPRRKSSVG